MECDFIINPDGTKRYYKKGTMLLHRIDGPAIEHPGGYRLWIINGIELPLEKQIILNQWWDNKNGI